MRSPRSLRFAVSVTLAALAAARPSQAQDAPVAAVQPPELLGIDAAPLPDGTEFPAPELAITVKLDVTTTGTVASASLLQGVGDPFDGAALVTARTARFRPATLTGNPIRVTISFVVRLTRPEPVAVEPPPPPPPPPSTLIGRVLERGTRKPVVAEVRVESSDGVLVEGVSGQDGRFSLEASARTATVYIDPAAHESLALPVALEPGKPFDLGDQYVLKTGSSYETTVRARVVRTEPTKRIVEREQIRNAPGTAGDTIQIIQSLPGVARNSFGGGPPILRGSAPGDSAGFLEGQELAQIYHFGGLRSTVASSFLERLEFIPGNFGPEYGRLLGGVVDVKLRDPADDLFRGEVDLNVYDAGFALEGPVTESFSLGGAFHRSWIDTILPAFIPDDSPVSFSAAPRYYDYQLIGTYEASKSHKLRGVYYGSMDKLSILFDNPADDPVVRGGLSTRIAYHNLLVDSRSKPAEGVEQTLALRGGYSEIQFQLGPDFFFDLSVFDVALRGEWKLQLSKQVTFRGGTDSRVRWVSLGLSAPEPPKEGENPVPVGTLSSLGVDTTEDLFEPALYAELEVRPLEGLTLRPGVRADYSSAITTLSVDPRLSVDYELSKDLTLRAGVGLYQQQPEYDESAGDTGNPDLTTKRALHTSLGFDHVPLDGVRLEVTGFAKWLDHLVVRNLDRAFDESAVPYTNEGTGRIYGVEALLRFDFRDLNGWIAYTFQRSLRTDRPGEAERTFDFDQPHILSALASWSIGAGWTLGGRFRLVSGNPTTPVAGSIYDAVSDTYVPVYEKEKSRLPTFHQLDVRLDKTYTFDDWTLTFYMDVQNVYNRGNVEGYQYNFDYSKSQPQTGLPVVPVFGVRGSW